uniref:Uncharacterized protein n=1 Tax=OCS116 cluster bacterium TaxID=2030921 RepID=A0A2A4YUV6_9PROT
MHIERKQGSNMQQNQNIIQKEYLLGTFYDEHSDDIEKLCQNCAWQNTYYQPKKALELLNGICRTDRVNVQVFALFNLHDDHEELIAFFPYNVQNNRWVLPIKCFISWWDEVIEDNAPLIHKDYTEVSFYYLAYFLKEKTAILLIHQCSDEQFITACDNSAVHIFADYNHSKTTHKIYISNSNITSLLKMHYAKIVETVRLKIRDILS